MGVELGGRGSGIEDGVFFLLAGGLAGYSACACGGGVENICEGEFGGRGGGGGVVGVGCEGGEISARHLNGILQDNGTSSSRENDQSIKHHPATSAYTTLVLNVLYTQTYIIPPSSYHREFVIHDEFQPGQKTTTNSTSFKFCTPPGVDQTGCMEVGTSERIYSATKPTHTPTQSSTPTIRRNILEKNPHPLFHALSPHHPPIKCPLSHPFISNTTPFSHISSTTNRLHFFQNIRQIFQVDCLWLFCRFG